MFRPQNLHIKELEVKILKTLEFGQRYTSLVILLCPACVNEAVDGKVGCHTGPFFVLFFQAGWGLRLIRRLPNGSSRGLNIYVARRCLLQPLCVRIWHGSSSFRMAVEF